MSKLRLLCLLAASTSFAACGLEAAPPDDGPDSDFRIINGQPTDDSPEYLATVGLRFRVAGSFYGTTPSCSGTLIADDVVMTAAHCAVKVQGFTVKAKSPNDIHVWFDEDDVEVPLSEVLVHPGYNPSLLHNDIALLRLDGTAPVAPIPALPAAQGIDATDVASGTILDFVGFGYSDENLTQIGVKLHNELPIGALGCPYATCPANAPTDTQFAYSQVDNGTVEGPCSGDSGGPAFVDRGGTIYVAGITSYGDAQCTDYGVSTTVSAFETFIGDFTAPPDCSADGSCNAACAPGDDPDCGGGGTCGNGTCDAGESCDGRNGTSACGDCDGKTNGKPSGRYCWVEGACEGPGCP